MYVYAGVVDLSSHAEFRRRELQDHFGKAGRQTLAERPRGRLAGLFSSIGKRLQHRNAES